MKRLERVWRAYFLPIPLLDGNLYRSTYEVGYLDNYGSRLKVATVEDLLIAPARDLLLLELLPKTGEITVRMVDAGRALRAYWNVTARRAELAWTEYSVQVVVGPEDANRPPGKQTLTVHWGGQEEADPRQSPDVCPTCGTIIVAGINDPAAAGEGETHHVERK